MTKFPDLRNIKVLTAEEAERTCTILVCMRYPGHQPLDRVIVTLCVRCSRRVVRSKLSPEKLLPVCVECCGINPETGELPDGVEAVTSYEAAREVLTWLKGRR